MLLTRALTSENVMQCESVLFIGNRFSKLYTITQFISLYTTMQCDVYVGGNRLFRMGVELNKVHGMPPYVASGAVLVRNKNLKIALLH